MTGAELLQSVKKQFQVVYLPPTQLDALLAQSLRVYQSKAGPFTEVSFPADAVEIDTPADFAGVTVAVDANGRWVEASRVRTPASGETPATDKIKVVATTRTIGPYKLAYFQRLTPATDVPLEGESLIFSHLSALIEIPNNRRAREVANATGMTLEFPDDDQLKQRLDLIEQEMEECRGIIPCAAVF